MNWRHKLLLQLFLAIPAFSGYPLTQFDGEIVSGLSYAAVFYFIIVNASVRMLQGSRRYANIVAVTALITLPVVFSGAIISYLLYLFGPSRPGIDPFVFGAHYLKLCITMLTVIPLALSLVASLPIHAIETRLLTQASGVSASQKKLLMALRVFNHIVYYVIHDILEVVKEERRLRPALLPRRDIPLQERIRSLPAGFKNVIRELIQIAIEGICSAIQYIPLWAVEIAQLPGKEKKQGPDQRARHAKSEPGCKSGRTS
jgi:hypothetical protein